MPKPNQPCQLVVRFAENVRRERRARGLSQEALADLADVHRTYIGMLERGEKNVTLSTLDRIASALGVSAISLLDASAPDEQ
ncbi:helix-turn-helix domain-containing protein [Marinimicrobium sp. C6131]|uniref:helix-turn-helix domain-containing protein n=1 Tax=Marinimicrobium sp. C6131 TaxID=3022676 RepID=UPI00223DD698|nr:helix-turn-helix transcriptional regulator [Marinimicrobium sp. C6131]UZJ44458.1 helix-turn-helix domain-containing protein [Marinimicrobium sp. C6131]